MMNKLIELGCEVEQTGEARVQEISPSLVKTASTEIQRFWDALKPNQRASYVHVIGMTAGEFYGPNRNGDWFSEENLIKYHDTFRTNAHVFLHHVNKDPEKSVGKVLFSWYNMNMHRVELICEIDKNKALAAKTISSIKLGEQLYVSMGCRVEFDVCSICGNQAKTRAQYCDCLKFNMKGILKDGRQVYSINPGPLRFFDISFVNRPADPTAFALDKIASEGGEPVMRSVMLSAELGEEMDDYAEKIAAVAKLSTLLKRIDGDAVDIVDPDVPSAMLRQLRDTDQLRHLDIPALGFSDIMQSEEHPRDILKGIFSLGAPPSMGEMAVCAGKDLFGGMLTQNMVGSILDLVPQALRILREHPEVLDVLSALWLPRNSQVSPEVQHLVAPVVQRRVIMIRSAFPQEEFMPLLKEAGLFPGMEHPPTPAPPVGFVRRFMAGAPGDNEHGALDKYVVIGPDNQPYVTNAMSVRAAAQASDPAAFIHNLLAAAVAVGGLATLSHAPGLLEKAIGAVAMVGGGMAMFSPGESTFRTVDGHQVPVRAAFTKHSSALAKEAPRLAMALPALLGADYLVNKHVRYRNDPYYEERLSTGHRIMNSLGKTVVKHPFATIGATGLLGRIGALKYGPPPTA